MAKRNGWYCVECSREFAAVKDVRHPAAECPECRLFSGVKPKANSKEDE